MTDIEQKALALVNEVQRERGLPSFELYDRTFYTEEALCRAIEQHEAFRQEVSDAVHKHWGYMPCEFDRFIVTKPDPLAECLLKLGFSEDDQEARHDAEWLVKTIEARGGKIVWGEG